jgi:hypothetical protein
LQSQAHKFNSRERDHVAQAAKMEACVIFPAPAGALMRWPLVGGQSLPRQPDEAADGSVGEAAGEQDGDSSTRVWMPVVEEIYSPGNEKRL